MKSHGFTVVELIIVIVVIGILAGLGTLGFSHMQVEARNTQRVTKVENIAKYLESIYQHGHTLPRVEQGTYPRVSTIANSCNGTCSSALSTNPWPMNTARLENLFGNDGFDLNNLRVPELDTGYSLVVARNASTTSPSPAPTINTFVYQPLTVSSSGGYNICNLLNDECRAFNLLYLLEGSPTIQVISSRNR